MVKSTLTGTSSKEVFSLSCWLAKLAFCSFFVLDSLLLNMENTLRRLPIILSFSRSDNNYLIVSLFFSVRHDSTQDFKDSVAPGGEVDSKIIKCSWLSWEAIICDADLIYQFYYDDMSVNHHDYWTHIPYYWSFFLVVPILTWVFSKRLSIASIFFLSGVFLHLVLDSVLTGIKWKYPVDDSYIGIIPISDVKVLVSPTKIHHLFENSCYRNQ